MLIRNANWNWPDIRGFLLVVAGYLAVGAAIVVAVAMAGLENAKREGESAGHKRFDCGEVRLALDEACLVMNVDGPASVLAQSSECVGCDVLPVWTSKRKDNPVVVDTAWPTRLEVVSRDMSVCDFFFHFEQDGEYVLNAFNNSTNGTWKCDVATERKPVNAFLPIVYACGVMAALNVLWIVTCRVYSSRPSRRLLMRIFLRSTPDIQDEDGDSLINDDPRIQEATSAQIRRSRLKSLDAFRGFSLAVMIFVNYGGGEYWFFAHSPWNGLTVADLVFPWFMWIMGVSLVMSIQSRLRNSISRRRIIMQVVKRSLILFALGVFLNSGGGRQDLRQLRVPGVLQRFALTYLVVAVCETAFMRRESPTNSEATWWWPLRDIVLNLWQWLIMLSLVAAHTCITFLLPVHNCPKGYVGPGGLHDGGSFQNCTGGAARAIDVAGEV
jgi:heparan-alpha-glucosaminide N-acetyltransferase